MKSGQGRGQINTRDKLLLGCDKNLTVESLSTNPMMASFSSPLHRPLSAMAVAAFAAVSSLELPDKLSHHKLADNADAVVSLPASKPEASLSSASALSGLQFLPRNQAFDPSKAPVASLPVIQTVYQYAKFAKTSGQEAAMPAILSSSSSDVLYRWHLPDPRACGDSSDKSQTVVVLLGWLGSKQKHLKRYADWYTSRGFHAVTFTLPMSDIVSYNVGGKAKNVEMLSKHLAGWVREENGKKIVFHTFSNTGWLRYGVILENLQQQDPSAMDKIKGCVVDSAPVAVADSQVWALGFSAAIMKKHSVATKGAGSNDTRSDVLVVESHRDIKPAGTEAVLLSALEKFFDVVLNYPSINSCVALFWCLPPGSPAPGSASTCEAATIGEADSSPSEPEPLPTPVRPGGCGI